MNQVPMQLHPQTGNPTPSSLVERIAAYPIATALEHIPTTLDRWVLVSNLQKSIRRGLVPAALGTVTKLLAVDPRYFWRRLLVIAYEDVGYGDINLCHDLLKTFRREALQREIGPERVAQYFTHQLASSIKSRSLCDALAMLEFSVIRHDFERQSSALTDEQLLATACDAALPFMNRISAVRHICGYGVFANGRYQSLSPARPELMRELCRRAELTEVETTLFRSGQNVAESLNNPIPLIAQLVRAGPQGERRAAPSFEGQEGLLYAALDRHTRAGKRCLARLAKEVAPVRDFFTQRKALNPVAVLGTGVFIVEGAVLDRQLVFAGADSLRHDFNQNFLESVGVVGADQEEFLALVSQSQDQLNLIRAGEVA